MEKEKEGNREMRILHKEKMMKQKKEKCSAGQSLILRNMEKLDADSSNANSSISATDGDIIAFSL